MLKINYIKNTLFKLFKYFNNKIFELRGDVKN